MTPSEQRELQIVERGMAGYETLQAIRRASRIRSVAERRRQRRLWLLYGALAGVIVGLVLIRILG